MLTYLSRAGGSHFYGCFILRELLKDNNDDHDDDHSDGQCLNA